MPYGPEALPVKLMRSVATTMPFDQRIDKVVNGEAFSLIPNISAIRERYSGWGIMQYHTRYGIPWWAYMWDCSSYCLWDLSCIRWVGQCEELPKEVARVD